MKKEIISLEKNYSLKDNTLLIMITAAIFIIEISQHCSKYELKTLELIVNWLIKLF